LCNIVKSSLRLGTPYQNWSSWKSYRLN
jgi:hypothetical protein